MYQPEDGKPLSNQPPSATTTGFPVSVNNNTSAAYSGATTSMYAPPSATITGFPVNFNSSTSTAYSGATTTDYAPPPSKPLVEWSTNLCNCCSNVEICCLTFWCPCITFGRVAEIIDKGSTSCGYSGTLYTLISLVLGCCCLYSCCYRSKMREQYGLKGNDCTDCMIHCCCETCALCQEYRELHNRGFNMVIGWHRNVEQQTRGIAMSTTAPAVVSGMYR
ncbi:unnamed protein product [Trifolium pratense]|uniref:Uncharacterized protein n=1 Tax=Trifolium pratense TaxID=57577 RepID=A0ACB0M644_TRIPR|nr:unnamed protein product [Trifolium pratense]